MKRQLSKKFHQSRIKTLLNFVLLFLGVAAPLCLSSSLVFAGKLSFSTGLYSIQVQGGSGSAGIANFSLSRLSYGMQLGSRFELSVGTSILTSGFYSGDLAFGVDISGRFSRLPRTGRKHGPMDP